jgi:AhpD family alkylhydroperoxidase
MTTTDSAAAQAAYVEIPVRFDFDSLAPKASRAVATLHKAAIADLAAAGVEQGLIELIRLRASQLNGCAYCVDTHSADARSAGVSGQRLDMLPVWQDAPLFTARERAALALTESVTRLSETHAPEPVVAEALTLLAADRRDPRPHRVHQRVERDRRGEPLLAGWPARGVGRARP